MLDAIGFAIITVNPAGRILQANLAGATVLQRADALLARNGGLACLDISSFRKLTQAIESATAPRRTAAQSLLLERPLGLRPYHVTITPIGEPHIAMIVFCDPDTEDGSLSGRLRALFRLTAAEAKLAIALAQGKALAEIATRRGVQTSTVRSQMKSIAAKMRCNRQAEIVAIVAGLPPLRLAP